MEYITFINFTGISIIYSWRFFTYTYTFLSIFYLFYLFLPHIFNGGGWPPEANVKNIPTETIRNMLLIVK